MTPKDKKEVIHFFGNRYHNGAKCFDIDESYISENIEEMSTYAYIRVNEVGYDDHATAFIYIKNWCHQPTPQVFIMTLCRSGSQRSKYSPVNILFELSESIARALNQKYIYLFPERGDGFQKLIEVYKGYGFHPTSDCYLTDEYKNEYPMRRKIRHLRGTRKRNRCS